MYTLVRLFWIGICAVAMLSQTRLLFRLPLVPGWLDGFVFAGVIFGYYFMFPKRRLRALARGLGMCSAVCCTQLQAHTRFAAILPALVWILYYFAPRAVGRGLRSLPLGKPLAIAAAWALATVLLPAPPALWPDLGPTMLGRAAFVFALALACDLHDRDYDRLHGLQTLVLRLGPRRSLLLIDGALALAAICTSVDLILHLYDRQAAYALWGSLAFSAFFLRWQLRQPFGLHVQKILVDGLMFLQFGLVLLDF